MADIANHRPMNSHPIVVTSYRHWQVTTLTKVTSEGCGSCSLWLELMGKDSSLIGTT